MTLQELQAQAVRLPVQERLALIVAIAHSISDTQTQEWQYLVVRPHTWRKQLYIKGQKLLASTVWRDIQSNEMTEEEAAENWDLPVAAIREAVHYSEANSQLIQLEADEERCRLEARGVSFESQSAA